MPVCIGHTLEADVATDAVGKLAREVHPRRLTAQSHGHRNVDQWLGLIVLVVEES